MVKCRTATRNKEIYIKAPRFIDHHIAQGRTLEEVNEAKSTMKEIINHCIDENSRRKVVVDLEHTDHIAKSCIQVICGLIRDASNFIMYHPNQDVHKKLVDNGFPQANIML